MSKQKMQTRIIGTETTIDWQIQHMHLLGDEIANIKYKLWYENNVATLDVLVADSATIEELEGFLIEGFLDGHHVEVQS